MTPSSPRPCTVCRRDLAAANDMLDGKRRWCVPCAEAELRAMAMERDFHYRSKGRLDG